MNVVAEPRRARRQLGLDGLYAAIDEYLTGRENLNMIGRLYHLGRRRSRVRAAELPAQFGLTDAADRPARTYPAACVAAWTWRARWLRSRRCCSWTSPRPAWTPALDWTCGR